MQRYPNTQDSSAETAGNNWYAIYTKHQHEKTACEYLQRKEFEVLLPLYSAVRRWKDRKKVLQLPLFPCYLFIRTNLVRRLDVLKAPGVFWFVESGGGRTCEIPECEIAAIRRIVESPARVEPHRFLNSGEYVEICRGPLLGVKGILLRLKSNYRVVLSVDALQKGIAVEVDISDVRPLYPHTKSAAAARG